MSQLKERIPPVIVDALLEMYNDARDYCAEVRSEKPHRHNRHHGKEEDESSEPEIDGACVVKIFRRLLAEVPDWDDVEIEDETKRFTSRVPWMRAVLQQVIVAQVHILVSVRNNQYVERPRFAFEMPREKEIVHKLLIAASKRVRPHAKLFDTSADDDIDAESKMITVEELVRKSVESTVSNLVPLDDIVAAISVAPTRAPAGRRKKAGALTVAKEEQEDDGEEEEEQEPEEEEKEELEEDDGKQPNEIELKEMEKQISSKRAMEEKKHKEEEAIREEKNPAKFVPIDGEEHIDDLVEYYQSLSRDDPKRQEVRRMLKKKMQL